MRLIIIKKLKCNYKYIPIEHLKIIYQSIKRIDY